MTTHRHDGGNVKSQFRFGIRVLLSVAAILAFVFAAFQWLHQHGAPIRNVLMAMTPWVGCSLIGAAFAFRQRYSPTRAGFVAGAVGAFIYPGYFVISSGSGSSLCDFIAIILFGSCGASIVASILSIGFLGRNSNLLSFKWSSSLELIAVSISMVVACAWITQPHPDWQYSGQLHAAISVADRIIVRDGGDEWPGIVDSQPILFEITDMQEISRVIQHLSFDRDQSNERCGCRGYPTIEWYKGEARLAIMSLQHGKSLRWDGLAGDAKLTGTSSHWIVQWLVSHGVPSSKLK